MVIKRQIKYMFNTELAEELPNNHTDQFKLTEPTAIEPEKVPNVRVLVVDDDLIVQQFLVEILTDEGYEVDTIDNGSDTLEKLKREDYDVILLDIKLPGISGIDLYEHLRKKAQTLARKIIFITGDTTSRDTLAFMGSVQRPCILKPFSVKQLLEGIDQILS